MWKLFFEVCDLLCYLIPRKSRRDYVRHVRLHDWRRKYNALRRAFPELNFRRTKMIKGGWNIGFIVDNKYVFKIRKNFDATIPADKIVREQRITDAFAKISPLKIPKIEIVDAGVYRFFKYDFIPGRNLTTLPLSVIRRHRQAWARQIAEFVYAVHNARPSEIDDLRNGNGDGWNHNDICNNIIVNPKTMEIVGLIDWEYAGWGTLETELQNTMIFSKKMRELDFQSVVASEYKKLKNIQNKT